MAGPDLLDPSVRTGVIKEIREEDNHSRKREAQRRFDIYRERQDRYIIERLHEEFEASTVCEMRKILSINLAKRIVDEEASVYNTEPDRQFTNSSERELEQLENLYRFANANNKLRQGNRWYKLQDQTWMQVLPKDGTIQMRPVQPHQIDVVPSFEDPEKAHAIIMNVWDLDFHKTTRDSANRERNNYYANDHRNQSIADDSDRKAELQRFVVWTDDIHFTMDGRGKIVTEVVPNPIGMIPFVEIATEKDFQYFVRRGSNVADFAIDFGVQISDLANIIRMQGYSQAIVFSQKVPKNFKVGPTSILHLPLDPNKPEMNPRFEFVSPNPDLSGSLNFIETTLRMFLSSRGIDTATVTGKGEGKAFSSGMERLLAMLDKFEATRADFDLFQFVEDKLLDVMRAWSNRLQGTDMLRAELQTATLNDQITVDVKFFEPVVTLTQGEKESSVKFRLDEELMTRTEAIMELRGVEKDNAKEILEEIKREKEETEVDPVLKLLQGSNNGESKGVQDNQDGSESDDQLEGAVRG